MALVPIIHVSFCFQSEILDVALVNHSNAQPEPIFTRRQRPDANVRFVETSLNVFQGKHLFSVFISLLKFYIFSEVIGR